MSYLYSPLILIINNSFKDKISLASHIFVEIHTYFTEENIIQKPNDPLISLYTV